jgi:serine/threonine protein kinase/tetratricopeptide (TPR) repeat protein
MIGKKVSHYKILEEIGAGGMGIVYKAEDYKLNRTVALKFVVPRIVRREEDRIRFVREAQTAASLNHPNICTIYEIDEEGENLFIAMEYVEGQSLKDIIEKGPLKIELALDTAIQIADGLKEAHDAGVVHRDIKSSNILITKKGQAKIMDFGLARPVKDSKLTETATIMGTVAYMSPEQASGEPYDHRTDIWSFGVVLYEMLSGQFPFGGEHQQLILYSILNQNPQPIKNLPYALPLELERIIHRCLEKEPSERYQRADELLEDLRRLKKETETGIVLPRRKITEKTRRVPSMAIAIAVILLFVVVVLFTGYILFDWFKPPVKWRISIAVLPFENIKPLGVSESLCQSVHRALIDTLALICTDLRVVPPNSVAKYKGQSTDLRTIGRELGVEYVLSSTIQGTEQQVLVTTRLNSAKDNRLIKPYKGESEEKDLFTLIGRLSSEIVRDLDLGLSLDGIRLARKEEPSDFQAYEYYQKGMNLVDESDNYSDPEEWFSEALNMFYQALNIEPNYARAYWGIGAAHEAYYVAKKKKENLRLMLENMEKAYDLNPELPETNVSLGWAYFYKKDLDNAYRSFKKALELGSDRALINCDVGAYLYSIGLYRSANKYFSKAIQLEPSYLRAYQLSAICNWNVGEFDGGVRDVERALNFEKDDISLYLIYAKSLIMMKKYAEAEQAIERAESLGADLLSVKSYRAFLSASKGERDKALSLIEDVDRAFDYNITCAYSLLGMKGEAIENIKKGIEVGFEKEQYYFYPYLFLKESSCFEKLRDDPRFQEVLKKQEEIYNQKMRIHKNLL